MSDAPDALPRGEAEELVAAIWCDVFNLERIGRHDDFYELGGHSLLAIRMASRLRDTVGLKVPLRLILDNPTVAEMARLIQRPT
ncbi:MULTISPECIES: phosphopantetheine-binding protein [unclassified Streptosporangium]|uniref:phosphopantetheine-binding protein n=1 Tax=unclassified Streptosporangium TaxID=2632669 RepID=UPI002E2BE6EA|nr:MULTISPECIES: phosphopantetheine-binding protein [unclassified Streptosporangium]